MGRGIPSYTFLVCLTLEELKSMKYDSKQKSVFVLLLKVEQHLNKFFSFSFFYKCFCFCSVQSCSYLLNCTVYLMCEMMGYFGCKHNFHGDGKKSANNKEVKTFNCEMKRGLTCSACSSSRVALFEYLCHKRSTTLFGFS